MVPWAFVSFILVAGAALPASEVTVLPGLRRMRVRRDPFGMAALEVSERVRSWLLPMKLEAWNELGAIDEAKDVVD